MITDFDFVMVGEFKQRTDRHRLAGVITVDGVPAKRLVTVIFRKTLSCVAAKTSDPNTGKWEIAGIPEYAERSLLVLALDDTGTYNAEVADFISQVAAV